MDINDYLDSVVGNKKIKCIDCGMRSNEQPLYRSNKGKIPAIFKCEQHIDVKVNRETIRISNIAKEL